jgi:hypothetical protein
MAVVVGEKEALKRKLSVSCPERPSLMPRDLWVTAQVLTFFGDQGEGTQNY